MPDLRLRTRLLADSDVTELVAARVEPSAERTGAVPAVVYTLAANDRHGSLTDNGASGVAQVELELIAESYLAAKQLAAAVYAALDGWTETSGDPRISFARLESEGLLARDDIPNRNASQYTWGQTWLLQWSTP